MYDTDDLTCFVRTQAVLLDAQCGNPVGSTDLDETLYWSFIEIY
jgi:hypothetical protein